MSLRLHILLAVLLVLPLAGARAGIGIASALDGNYQIAVQDGGSEEPTGGDSGEEAVSGGNVSGSSGADEGGENADDVPSSFVRAFEVPDEDYFFVHGHRIRGTVECTWTQGGPLIVGGFQVLPAPNRLAKNRSEEYYRSHFGDYPLVLSLVESGMSWREASRAWKDTVVALDRQIAAAYRAVLASSGSCDEAQRAAEQVVAGLPASLVDHAAPPRWMHGMLCVPWSGPKVCLWLPLEGEMAEEIPIPETPPYWTALSLVTNVRELLKAPGPSVFVIPSVGGASGEASNDPIHAENVEKVLSQIRDSSPGRILPGGLPDYAVEEILAEGGLSQ